MPSSSTLRAAGLPSTNLRVARSPISRWSASLQLQVNRQLQPRWWLRWVVVGGERGKFTVGLAPRGWLLARNGCTRDGWEWARGKGGRQREGLGGCWARLARRASRYYANLVKLRAGQTVLQTLHYRIKIITMKGLGATKHRPTSLHY